MYTLDNSFARYDYAVAVVGCGGTGGFVAEGLCRVLPRRVKLALIDHDRVEERNLIRQNFTRRDLGRFKAESLAERLSCDYERPVAYSTLLVQAVGISGFAVVIGCLDNGPARRAIEQRLSAWQPFWWIDCGNGENFGQVLIGDRKEGFQASFDTDREVCLHLPAPHLQRPEILAQVPRRSCADAQTAGDQAPVINQVMAALAVEVVRRLTEGTCPWMALYLDLEAGTLSPVLATPENAARISSRETRRPERR